MARRYRYRLLKTWLISLAVFCVGVSITAFLYADRLREHRADQLQAERANARQLHFELQRRMDLYEGANRDLAAFFGASESVSAQEFHDFIHASRFLSRLEGISSAGYLPKVSVAERPGFERWARTLYPSFQIQKSPPGSEFAFPLLYSENDTGREPIAHVRGLDYSSIPDRLEAMQRALKHDRPTATRVHQSISDRKTRVVVIFMPVRKTGHRAVQTGQRMAQLQGFTVSVLRVDELFAKFYETLGAAKQFDVEVYDGQTTGDNLVFAADHIPHALAGKPDAYHGDLQFANQRWSVHFFPVAHDLSAKRLDGLVLTVGLLLSLIAAYGVVFVQKLLQARRADRDLLDRFDTFFENHPFAVCSLDPQWRFIHANQKLAHQLGVSQADLAGQWAGDYISPETRDMAAQRFREAMNGEAVAYNNVLIDSHGKRSDVSVVLIPMTTRGKATHVLAFAENITERKSAEAALYESRQMLRLILDTVPQRIFWKDPNGVFQGGNRRLLDEAGLDTVDELVGKTDYDMPWREMAVRYRSEDAEVMESGVPRLKVQQPHRRGGVEYWIEASKIPLLNDEGKPVGVLGVVDDITERKAIEEELSRRANFDSLTSLPNRAYFYAQLEQAVKRAARRRVALALMYFDIDRFKHINDTYGHDVGDDVIRTFASRVRGVVRDEDVVARLGGDEFIMIVENLADEHAADVIAAKLVDSMAEPFKAGEVDIQVTTSIGVASYKNGMTPDQLVKAGDDAMYAAKRAGGNCFRRAGD